LAVETVSWHDLSVDWGAYELVLLRSCWDYIDDVDGFVAWARHVAGEADLLNPAELVAWNVDKGYLLELADEGVPVVPTVRIEPGARARLDRLMEKWREIVIKPSVGAGSWMVARYTPAALERAAAHVENLHSQSHTVLVQPCLESVFQRGESGVYVIDGRATYMISKSGVLARDAGPYDDFQLSFAQQVALRPLDNLLSSLAEEAVDRLPGRTPLYARVDLVSGSDNPVLLEVELIEPVLFLDRAPEAVADHLAEAVVRRMTELPGHV
jgi:glutathione synthase/RimK-type ligase-like ATP-grasp enzyme